MRDTNTVTQDTRGRGRTGASTHLSPYPNTRATTSILFGMSLFRGFAQKHWAHNNFKEVTGSDRWMRQVSAVWKRIANASIGAILSLSETVIPVTDST